MFRSRNGVLHFRFAMISCRPFARERVISLATLNFLRISFTKVFRLHAKKFIHSERAAKFCEIFTLLLSYVVPVKSKAKISQNCVAFSEYMNFTKFEWCSYIYIKSEL